MILTIFIFKVSKTYLGLCQQPTRDWASLDHSVTLSMSCPVMDSYVHYCFAYTLVLLNLVQVFCIEFAHLSNKFAHVSIELAHVSNQFTHVSNEFAHVSNDFAHLSNEFVHLSNEVAHTRWCTPARQLLINQRRVAEIPYTTRVISFKPVLAWVWLMTAL